MKKKFFVTLSAIIVVLIAAVSVNAQSKTVNLENISATDKSETQIYDKKGKLLYTVYRYEENELPKEIRSTVKREYYDYDIVGVEEVQTPGNASSVYFVHVQNDSKLKLIKVYDGTTELVKEYKRG